MEMQSVAGLFAELSQLRKRDRWTRTQLEPYQAEALRRVRVQASAHSPFYKRIHAGLEDRPLQELPVVTKTMLMEHFDEVVTDRAVGLADVRTHMAQDDDGKRYLDRYWVSATSGSTGQPGIFLFDRREWSTVLASFTRSHEWAGVEVSLTHRMKMASVASTTRWHLSNQVGESLQSWWMPALRLAATEPVDSLVHALNDWQPEMLVTYASMARVLADEQLAGRLSIAPHLVFTSSEVLTPETCRRAEWAWGHAPFDEYAATETGGLAAECGERRGMHLFEDLVIVEVVDEQYRPVPAGITGDRLLVTSLFSRTQPLIRYELSDRIRLAIDACPCGRTFHLIDEIQGREEEVLQFPSASGKLVAIHPNVFHALLDATPTAGWQVVQDGDRLTIRLQGASGKIDADELASMTRQALVAHGAAGVDVIVDQVDALPRGPGGKAPLVLRLMPLTASAIEAAR